MSRCAAETPEGWRLRERQRPSLLEPSDAPADSNRPLGRFRGGAGFRGSREAPRGSTRFGATRRKPVFFERTTVNHFPRSCRLALPLLCRDARGTGPVRSHSASREVLMRHQNVLRRGVERCALRPPDTAIRCEFRDGGCLEATQVYKYLSRVGEMWYDRCLGSVPTGSTQREKHGPQLAAGSSNTCTRAAVLSSSRFKSLSATFINTRLILNPPASAKSQGP